MKIKRGRLSLSRSSKWLKKIEWLVVNMLNDWRWTTIKTRNLTGSGYFICLLFRCTNWPVLPSCTAKPRVLCLLNRLDVFCNSYPVSTRKQSGKKTATATCSKEQSLIIHKIKFLNANNKEIIPWDGPKTENIRGPEIVHFDTANV